MRYSKISTWSLRTILSVFIGVGVSSDLASAQTPDSKGTEFVLSFMENWQNGVMKNSILYIASDVDTTGTVEIPGLGFLTPFSVSPGLVTSVVLPAATPVIGSDVIQQKGVLVTSSEEIAVYGLNQAVFTTDAFLGLPTDILGTEYIVLARNENLSLRLPNMFDPTAAPSEFLVVGVEDQTAVTITSSIDTGTRIAGVPFTIVLNRLESYQLQSDDTLEDLTGTVVTADKPIAVFGGGVCLDIPDNTLACDHLVEQLPPTNTWGQNFLTVPLAARSEGDLFRILASHDATQVSLDGASIVNLDRSEFVELDLLSDTFHEIKTSKPALLMQYSKSTAADGLQGDPFMMIIPPKEQFQANYTVSTPAISPIPFTNFINAVVAAADTPNCTIDGFPFSSPPTPIGSSGYSGIQEAVGIGSHVLSCPNPFGIYSYGFALNDSYGYPGGLALSPVLEFPKSVVVTKDYRYPDVCFEEEGFNCRGGTKLGDPLPQDEDGNFLLQVVVKKNDRVASSNPGQYTAVSRIEVVEPIEELWIEEDFTDCTEINRLNPLKGGGAVSLVWVDEGGTAHKIANAKSEHVLVGGGLVTAHLSNVPAGSLLLMYVKYKLGLDSFSEPVSCQNFVSIFNEHDGGAISTASATLKVVEKTTR